MKQFFSMLRFNPSLGLGDLAIMCSIIGTAAVLVWRVGQIERVQGEQQQHIAQMEKENYQAHLEIIRTIAAITGNGNSTTGRKP